MVHWSKHQWIGHPSPSFLPASPREWPHDFGIPEASGRLRGRRRKKATDEALEAGASEIQENCEKKVEDDAPVVVTRQSVLRDLRRIQRRAEADGSHPSALRSVELAARIGLAADLQRESEYDDDTMGPSPADLLRPRDMSPNEFHGLPVTTPRRSAR